MRFASSLVVSSLLLPLPVVLLQVCLVKFDDDENNNNNSIYYNKLHSPKIDRSQQSAEHSAPGRLACLVLVSLMAAAQNNACPQAMPRQSLGSVAIVLVLVLVVIVGSHTLKVCHLCWRNTTQSDLAD
jgi:hypothetical protein